MRVRKKQCPMLLPSNTTMGRLTGKAMNEYVCYSANNTGNGRPDANREIHRNGLRNTPLGRHTTNTGETGYNRKRVWCVEKDSVGSNANTDKKENIRVAQDRTSRSSKNRGRSIIKIRGETGFTSEVQPASHRPRNADDTRGRTVQERNKQGKTRTERQISTAEKRHKRKEKQRLSKQYVDELRTRATPAEKAMCRILDCYNIKYIFQFPILKHNDFYILDFYLPDYATVIEVDGGYHTTQQQIQKDNVRTAAILRKSRFGRVVRFTNDEVLQGDVKDVMHKLALSICPWMDGDKASVLPSHM